MKHIKLTQGKHAIVDDCNYDWLSQWKWYALRHRNTYYAVRHSSVNHDETIWMHRAILGLIINDGKKSDHKNGNGLDNRRHNLRVCTNAQNRYNTHAVRGISKHKGVYWHKQCEKWCARTRFMGQNVYIGLYKDEDDAGKAYNAKAIELFGEFACINNI